MAKFPVSDNPVSQDLALELPRESSVLFSSRQDFVLSAKENARSIGAWHR